MPEGDIYESLAKMIAKEDVVGQPVTDSFLKLLKLQFTPEEAGHWSVSLCPCRVSRAIVDTENPCKHMVETCVHTGELSRWAVKHGMARELSHDELVEHLEKANRDGLVHTINLLGQICNCCEDCCAIFRTYKMDLPTFIPSPFAARVDEDTCTACGACADRCPVGAVEVDALARVKEERCLGCGVCVPTCPTESVKLARRPQSEQVEMPEAVKKAMD